MAIRFSRDHDREFVRQSVSLFFRGAGFSQSKLLSKKIHVPQPWERESMMTMMRCTSALLLLTFVATVTSNQLRRHASNDDERGTELSEGCRGALSLAVEDALAPNTANNNNKNKIRQRLAQVEEDDFDPMMTIRIAGIIDTTVYNWAADVFATTVQLINEGWWDILPEGFRLMYDLEDAGCDATTAVRAYWKLRSVNNNDNKRPIHGIVGGRCSAATVSLARFASLEGVPQISPASQTTRLSNEEEFPYFSRLMAPNNDQGESKYVAVLARLF